MVVRIVHHCTSRQNLIVIVAIFATSFLFWWQTSKSNHDNAFPVFGGGGEIATLQYESSQSRDEVMEVLHRKGVYNRSDFASNELGIVVPYWDRNSTESDPAVTKHPTVQWGPCFAPHQSVAWDKIIKKYQHNGPDYNLQIPAMTTMPEEVDLAGFCRPGFIIIGAGKCGTSVCSSYSVSQFCTLLDCSIFIPYISRTNFHLPLFSKSLYHYLTEHPRVLPALQKQIHYFRYYADRTMKWYLHFFPTATSFLASGGLLTGEASPGYLPYSDVAHMIKNRMGQGPRIIAIGREPIDRAYSSYRYNYVTPTLESMRKGRIHNIPSHKSDEYYTQYLFSFEDMMRAELQTLRECLAIPNGIGVEGARTKWGAMKWAQREYDRRMKLRLPPMVDLDGFCYGEPVSLKVIRKQWAELMEEYPDKVIEITNVHLKQSLIGRGLYTLPLEWWYSQFDRKEIYFMCTEELEDLTGEPINKLGQFLGLPSYNFSNIVSKGAYNVGGHRGYDKETSWTEIMQNDSHNTTMRLPKSSDIPLSDEFRRELENFIQPYNERLFELVGRRCNW